MDQRARRRIELIAFLGHGQRDEMRVRRRHRVDQPGRVFGRDQHPLERADQAGLFVRAVAHGDGVEAALRAQLIAHAARPQARSQHAPAQIAAVERGFIDGRLMRLVEGAEAEMDDPGLDLRAIISGSRNRVGQAKRGERIEPGHSL